MSDAGPPKRTQGTATNPRPTRSSQGLGQELEQHLAFTTIVLILFLVRGYGRTGEGGLRSWSFGKTQKVGHVLV